MYLNKYKLNKYKLHLAEGSNSSGQVNPNTDAILITSLCNTLSIKTLGVPGDPAAIRG